MSGERDAAYAIEFHYGANKNRMTIHDLRIELDGRVAQIDHLIINRLLDIWVCESKHFSEGVAVDEHGEWVAFYDHRPYGIPSPVEQNRRHIAVLGRCVREGHRAAAQATRDHDQARPEQPRPRLERSPDLATEGSSRGARSRASTR